MKSNQVSQQLKNSRKKTFKVLLKLGLIKTQREVELSGDNLTIENINKKIRKKYSSIINMGGTVSLIQEK